MSDRHNEGFTSSRLPSRVPNDAGGGIGSSAIGGGSIPPSSVGSSPIGASPATVTLRVARAARVWLCAAQKFFARDELALDCTVLQLTIVRRRKATTPRNGGCGPPRKRGARTP